MYNKATADELINDVRSTWKEFNEVASIDMITLTNLSESSEFGCDRMIQHTNKCLALRNTKPIDTDKLYEACALIGRRNVLTSYMDRFRRLDRFLKHLDMKEYHTLSVALRKVIVTMYSYKKSWHSCTAHYFTTVIVYGITQHRLFYRHRTRLGHRDNISTLPVRAWTIKLRGYVLGVCRLHRFLDRRCFIINPGVPPADTCAGSHNIKYHIQMAKAVEPPYEPATMMEIFDLITLSRSNKQNKRMFAIFSVLSNRSKPLVACNCDSKISMVKEFLRGYLIGNNFINTIWQENINVG